MRCIVGVVLFGVLYFGSCALLGEIVRARAVTNHPLHSQKVGTKTRARVLKKYHALVAVGAGVVTIVGCSLPSVLLRMSERSEWRQYKEWQRG